MRNVRRSPTAPEHFGHRGSAKVDPFKLKQQLLRASGSVGSGRDYVGTLGAVLFRLVPLCSTEDKVDGTEKVPKCAASGVPGG